MQSLQKGGGGMKFNLGGLIYEVAVVNGRPVIKDKPAGYYPYGFWNWWNLNNTTIAKG